LRGGEVEKFMSWKVNKVLLSSFRRKAALSVLLTGYEKTGKG
jgi:hypothetical protein